MNLGFIGREDYVVTTDEREWNVRSFSISFENASFFEIIDSAFATPARYVEEIFVRLSILESESSKGTHRFVFNPLFDVHRVVVEQVISVLKYLKPFDGLTIVADEDGIPAGYLIPDAVAGESAHLLSLLSTVDAALDARFCQLAFGIETRCVEPPRLKLAAPGLTYSNGFAYKSNRDIFRWTTERAVQLLELHPVEARGGLPLSAVMPHHAGDVLFFCLADRGVKSRFSRIVVNRTYCDIVVDNGPGLVIVPIDRPVINRSGELLRDNAMPDNVYFNAFKDILPDDSLYYYCRPSRDYNATKFHLIDHFAFAMGARFSSKDRLLTRCMRFAEHVPQAAVYGRTLKVLLHFDAGWPLKIYPRKDQERLIGMLQALGYTVTVLAADPETFPMCDATVFRSYVQLKELLSQHDIIVGMDSFPAHYAAHVLGLPTICLFSSTRPDNSNAPKALNYAALEKGLSCRPCYGNARCPLFAVSHCLNFSAPEDVVAEVGKILAGVEEGASYAGMTTSALLQEALGPEVITRRPSIEIRRLDLKHMALKALVHRTILCRFYRLVLLLREFASVVERDGILQAGLRTKQFLVKITRRWWNRVSVRSISN